MNLAELFRHETDLKALSAGEALFREGEHGDLMYVLMSGSAEITVHIGCCMYRVMPDAIF